MEPETRIAAALAIIFAIGLALVAIGLDVATKSAAFAVGLILCLATVKLVAGGPKQ